MRRLRLPDLHIRQRLPSTAALPRSHHAGFGAAIDFKRHHGTQRQQSRCGRRQCAAGRQNATQLRPHPPPSCALRPCAPKAPGLLIHTTPLCAAVAASSVSGYRYCARASGQPTESGTAKRKVKPYRCCGLTLPSATAPLWAKAAAPSRLAPQPAFAPAFSPPPAPRRWSRKFSAALVLFRPAANPACSVSHSDGMFPASRHIQHIQAV